MPTRTRPDPKYRHHKPTNQAVVTLSGKDVYLGVYGTPRSYEKYRRALAEWNARGRVLVEGHEEFTMTELAAAFWQYAESFYRAVDGHEDSELKKYRLVLKPLVALYGSEPAAAFSPKRLKAVRQRMIELGWARKYINRQVTRLKAVFCWAVGEELVPASVFQSLQAVSGLRCGKTTAPESPPVKPVPDAHIDAIESFVSRQVWTMIQIQKLTAARPGEVVRMRPIDLDMSGDVWIYALPSHKTAYHGHQRRIFIGPRAQRVLQPFVTGRPVNAFMFSPAEAEAERHADQRARRRTPLTPSQRQRDLAAQARDRVRKPRSVYDVSGYRRAIARACRRADVAAHAADPTIPRDRNVVPVWHPHQLRHNAATEIRRQYGIEMARIVLGHKSPLVTEIYAEQDFGKGVEVIRKIG